MAHGQGYEFIYAGVYNSPEGVVKRPYKSMSMHWRQFSGRRPSLFMRTRLLRLMKENGVTDVPFFCRGRDSPRGMLRK